MLRLELQDISKQYPSVKANDRVSLRVEAGTVHAILGENGAGKSTLMKIIYGAVRPDSGTVRWNGQPVSIHSPAQARALGISMVYQHFSLFDTLTVAENLFLGKLPRRLGFVDRPTLRHQAEQALARVGLDEHSRDLAPVKFALVAVATRSEASAKKSAAKFNVGMLVQVHYDPANPTQSVVDPRAGWAVLLWIVPVGFVALAYVVGH